METILWALVWFVVLGGALGLILSVCGKLFEVKSDPMAEQIKEILPGANCGGCGFSGCGALADAIAKGNAKYDSCPVASAKIIKEIGIITGNISENGDSEKERPVRYRAQVMCSGTNELAKAKYIYEGLQDCNAAMRLAGGSKMCPYGCIGLGSCVEACKFDAIHIINGVAAVDYAKCTACGMCVKACPKQIIKLIPYDAKYWIGCASIDKGAVTKSYCEVGCIGCKLCQKACPTGAITVDNNNANIDYSLCTGCGECEKACPRKIIWSNISQKSDGIVREISDLQPDRGVSSITNQDDNHRHEENK